MARTADKQAANWPETADLPGFSLAEDPDNMARSTGTGGSGRVRRCWHQNHDHSA